MKKEFNNLGEFLKFWQKHGWIPHIRSFEVKEYLEEYLSLSVGNNNKRTERTIKRSKMIDNLNMGRILNRLSEEQIYGKGMSKKEYLGLCEIIRGYINFKKITVDDAIKLGFGRWSQDDDLWLFPLWLYYVIPDGTKITYIDGSEGKFKAGVDSKDIRFGCLCYGIRIKEKKRRKSNEQIGENCKAKKQ